MPKSHSQHTYPEPAIQPGHCGQAESLRGGARFSSGDRFDKPPCWQNWTLKTDWEDYTEWEARPGGANMRSMPAQGG